MHPEQCAAHATIAADSGHAIKWAHSAQPDSLSAAIRQELCANRCLKIDQWINAGATLKDIADLLPASRRPAGTSPPTCK
jgi:hypothetical protein